MLYCHCEHVHGACTEETEVLSINSVKYTLFLSFGAEQFDSLFVIANEVKQSRI